MNSPSAKKGVTPLPCHCGRSVTVFPQEGGRGSGDLTSYYVKCKCGVNVRNLSTDGTKRSAVRQWNRIVGSNQ